MASEMDPATFTTIINNINSLYGNLISYTVGLILFVGAFVPAVISFFQRKQFNREYDELTKKIRNDIQETSKEAEHNLKLKMELDQKVFFEQFRAENEELKTSLRKEIGIIHGAAHHLQAQQIKEHADACLDSCNCALKYYLDGNDERNARSIILIIKEEIPKLSASDLNEDDSTAAKSLSLIIDKLKANNQSGRYSHDIDDINRLTKDVKLSTNEPTN